MTNTSKILLGVLGGLVVIGAIWLLVSWKHEESLGQLAQAALTASDASEQEKAAIKLEAFAGKSSKTGPRNPAQPHLLRVFKESNNPAVRAAAIRGLAGISDYEAVPAMLDLLDNESVQLRETAAIAISKLTDYQHEQVFGANSPPEKRRLAAARLREVWALFSKSTLKTWLQRLEEKDKASKL